MPKRKRSHEPSLEEKLTQWHKELARGMKTAKGFERQRLSKRIREAQSQSDTDKSTRLEREVAVLKSLDLQQAAHAHLCSSLLKIKGIAESPRLPTDLVKPIAKPDGLSDEEKAALHNVTSALCNRKPIRDVIEEAIMGTCVALRVPMPDKAKKGGKGKKEDKDTKISKKEQADNDEDSTERKAKKRQKKEESDEQSDSEAEEPEPILLKRQREKSVDDQRDVDSDENDGPSDDEPFEGFSDSDAEERAWSRYDQFVAGSSDSDDSDDDDGDGEDELAADSRARSVRKTTADDISLSSEAESESEPGSEDEALAISQSEDESSVASPPPKKSKRAKAGPITAGNSAFLPSLMGGYISGSESEASDLDLGPSRKNRRGQRARQAIWEKKYKDKAKHVQNQQNAQERDQGWDMRRGAVDAEDGSNKPWKKGIHNPFENKHIHPQRQQRMQSGGDHGRQEAPREPPKPKALPTRDDTGPLHPSWAAAKKAKEESQKVAFQGRKVVFD
ncbi:hypothetical protein M426DRAFT_323899 [Hypoxylon sp. CI-4A]|nr:hypothetical protein M426DRAFT_323899 [Hypoxylon sp. CI-4A]